MYSRRSGNDYYRWSRDNMEPDQSIPRPTVLGSRRRTTLSLSDLRTPLVENFLSMLPMGHDKALKYALYNVFALIIAAVCIVACWAAYCILEPFIRPLLWALLCGSVIYPFKDRLVSFTKEWLVMVKGSSTPLTFQLMIIPFRAIDSVSESIGTMVVSWWKWMIIGTGAFFVTYVVFHNPPVALGWIVYWILVLVFRTFVWFVSWINGQFVLTVTAVYLGAVLHFVYGGTSTSHSSEPTRTPLPVERDKDQKDLPQQGQEEQIGIEDAKVKVRRNRLMIRSVSIVAWALWFIYFCRFLPYSIMIILIVSLITGTIVYLRKHSLKGSNVPMLTRYANILWGGGRSAQNSRGVSRKGSIQTIPKSGRRNTYFGTPSPGVAMTPQMQTENVEHSVKEEEVPGDFNTTRRVKPLVNRGSGLSDIAPLCSDDDDMSHVIPDECEDEVDGVLDSNKFLYGVLCACLIVQVWNRVWLIHLLPIPVVYFGVKKICVSFGLKDFLERTIYDPFVDFYQSSCGPSRDLFPQPVRLLFRIIYEADRKFISVFESYLDMVATIVILVAVMVVSVIMLIFVATQFYAEGDHLVRVGANVINSTVSQYPEISKMLPEGWESLTGSLIGNAYHYGRDYIKTMIRDSVAEKNPEKAEEMEKQVIELWDRIYLTWNRTWNSFDELEKPSNISTNEEMGLEWDDIVKTGQNVTDWFDTSMLVNYVKQNYGQLRAVIESIWTVLIGNVSLAVSAITSVFSVLFGGGTALLNLIISFVVFFTALFYLLSASSDEYKPVEIFNAWFPGDGKHSSYFVAAIEDSVSGVFSATLKMSAFYGMWTWLIHTLFQVNIVFVPSFFAAIFAAVPLLMPYWAAFPAVLELWLIQGQWTKALLMLLAQMAPMSLVDAQIYSEIKGGGHPYLTALAVAGGIFYFGFQGAIMGPVVLCFLFVAVKVGSNYMKEGTSLD